MDGVKTQMCVCLTSHPYNFVRRPVGEILPELEYSIPVRPEVVQKSDWEEQESSSTSRGEVIAQKANQPFNMGWCKTLQEGEGDLRDIYKNG